MVTAQLFPAAPWVTDFILAAASLVLLFIGAAAALVALFLWLKRPKIPREPLPERHWPVSAFDPGAISPRVQRVREDPLAALHSRPHPSFHPAGLLAAARHMVAGLAYFGSQRDEPQVEDEGPDRPRQV